MAQKRFLEENYTFKYQKIANDLIAEIEGEISTMIKQSQPKAYKHDVYNIILREGVAAFLRRRGKPVGESDIGRTGNLEYPHRRILVPKDLRVFSGIDLPDNGILRYAADISGLKLWMSDGNGKNVYVSPLLQWYVGCGGERLRQDGWIGFVHPEDQQKTVDKYAEYLLRPAAVRFDYRFWRADGYWGYIVDLAQPRFDQDGSFIGFIGTMHEIFTERAAGPTGGGGNAVR